MSYSKHIFKSGEKLYATQLNEMEEQIAKNEADISALSGNVPTKEDLSDYYTKAESDARYALKGEFGGGSSASYALPILYLDDYTGKIEDMNEAKNKVKLRYVYADPNQPEQRTGFVQAKWQGDTSIGLAKQFGKANYSLQFFHDAKFKRKDKIKYGFGLKENKWVVKADWIDAGHARNIVSARLWADIVKSRHSEIPQELTDAPCYGAINGYPISIYENGQYHGLYTMNIPKDDFTFGMDKDNPLHCAMSANYQTGTCAFNAPSGSDVFSEGFTENTFWSCEVPDAMTAEVAQGFTDMITFVATATDEEFKGNVGNYIDVESMIDYYIYCYFMFLNDSLAKNIILLTFDGGAKWVFTCYDMDHAFGLRGTNGNWFEPNSPCPEAYQCTNSKLWERVENLYKTELYERYKELRATVLNLDYIYRMIDQFVSKIPASEYRADRLLWSQIPHKDVDHAQQMKNFITARAEYVDSQFEEFTEKIDATGIALNTDSITFATKDAIRLTATLTPPDATTAVKWTTSSDAVATVSATGLVTPVGDGSCVITATAGIVSASCNVTVADGLFDASVIKVSLVQDDYNLNTNSSPTAWSGFSLSDFIEIPEGTEVIECNSEKIAIYNAEKSVVEVKNPNTIASRRNVAERYQGIKGRFNARISCRDGSGATYFRVSAKMSEYPARIVNVKTRKFDEFIIPVTWSETSAYQINSDGTVSSGNYYVTDMFDVPTEANVLNAVDTSTRFFNEFGYMFYDESGNKISGAPTGNWWALDNGAGVIIPTNATKARIAVKCVSGHVPSELDVCYM